MIFAYWLDTRKGILLLAISFVSTLFILVINGSRISFLVVILVLLIIYAYKGNKVSWTVLASILLIFAIWAVVYGAYTREILPYGGLVYGGITDLQTGNAPVLSTYLMTFWNRLAPLNFDSLSHLVFILEQVPMNHDFLYGKSILGILAYSVPRILFPDKPYPIGMLFTQVFFPNTFLNGSGVTPSLLVDFYWNFGIPGIMLGMLGFGILIRTFNNYAENYKFQLGALICLALVGSHIFGWLKAGSDTPTQDILSLLIPWIIISGIIFKIKK
jgi:oligosaccharide repeat unit polymerase